MAGSVAGHDRDVAPTEPVPLAVVLLALSMLIALVTDVKSTDGATVSFVVVCVALRRIASGIRSRGRVRDRAVL